jgi:hypothetical protein
MDGRRSLPDAVAARRRAEAVSGLRRAARSAGGGVAPTEPDHEPGTERCEVCGVPIGPGHRHLLHLLERRILCACEPCWAMRSGDGDLRPTGQRTVWLSDLDVPDDVWAAFRIPIGLAFFMESTVTGCVVALYPSPGGATESELRFDQWDRMRALHPALATLEPDIEGLIADRLTEPPTYVIAPIDRCYELTGTVRAHWSGISGGDAVGAAVDAFFAQLRAQAEMAAVR